MKRLLRRGTAFLALAALWFASPTWASAWVVRPDPSVVYRLSVEAFGLGNEEDDTLLVLRIQPKDQPGFWAAERRLHRKRVGRTPVHQHAYIDGRTCPALEAAFAKLADLPPVRFGTPQHYDQVTMIMDGGELVLSGPGEGHGRLGPGGDIGRLVRIADHGGPLWAWWDVAEKSLETCWREDPKFSDGTVLKVRLATDEQAKREKT